MTSLKIETIQDKLFRIKANTDLIEEVLKYSDKDIMDQSTQYYTLEHLLQLSIQAILDIGTHILADEFHENPKTYAEVIVGLGRHNIISGEFAKEQEEMARFRNKLIHDYDSVDKKKVIEYGRLAPRIFKMFGSAFVDFLKKNKSM